jgi:hypothetical protein
MRENSLTAIAPSAIISYAKVKDFSSFELIAQKQQQMSKEEFIYYLTHEVNNFVQKDGRINIKIDKNGLLFANSVSPYAKKFIQNIEDGVKDLVLALHNKRYLTYSSCEGHGYSFRRYVGLALADEESRDYIANEIKALEIYGVKIKFMDTVANQDLELSIGKSINFKNKIDPTKENEKFKERETESFNIQFHRNYNDYCFMEIIILEEVEIKKFFKNPFYNLWLCVMKKFFVNKITKKITNLINSNNFKKYKY